MRRGFLVFGFSDGMAFVIHVIDSRAGFTNNFQNNKTGRSKYLTANKVRWSNLTEFV